MPSRFPAAVRRHCVSLLINHAPSLNKNVRTTKFPLYWILPVGNCWIFQVPWCLPYTPYKPHSTEKWTVNKWKLRQSMNWKDVLPSDPILVLRNPSLRKVLFFIKPAFSFCKPRSPSRFWPRLSAFSEWVWT